MVVAVAAGGLTVLKKRRVCVRLELGCARLSGECGGGWGGLRERGGGGGGGVSGVQRRTDAQSRRAAPGSLHDGRTDAHAHTQLFASRLKQHRFISLCHFAGFPLGPHWPRTALTHGTVFESLDPSFPLLRPGDWTEFISFRISNQRSDHCQVSVTKIRLSSPTLRAMRRNEIKGV